jgi:hypothetical protein
MRKTTLTPPATPKRRVMTEALDDAMDRKAGIKENSPRDRALDVKRGLPDNMRKGGRVK